MVRIKCNGCNSFFKGNRCLSNHFQYNLQCKTIHLDLNRNEQPVLVDASMFRETITAPVHSANSYFDNTKIDESEMEDLINNVDMIWKQQMTAHHPL